MLITELNFPSEKFKENLEGIQQRTDILQPVIRTTEIILLRSRLDLAKELNKKAKKLKSFADLKDKKSLLDNFHKATFERYDNSKKLILLNDLNGETSDQNKKV